MKKLETMVTERGQVSVPAAIRKHLQLERGTRLRWQEVSDHECRVIVQRGKPGPGARAMRGFAKRFRKPRPTGEWMRELREGEIP
jgi:bifunctional DNA-binding transcriptional regulator/antitoxin component of YhaV-PrlF toxin-antitoxin module